MAEKQKNTGFAFGVVLGAIAGIGAMIFAKKNQADIEKKVDDATDKIKEKHPKAFETITNIIDSAKEAFSQVDTSVTESPPKKKTKTPKKSRSFTRKGKSLSPDA